MEQSMNVPSLLEGAHPRLLQKLKMSAIQILSLLSKIQVIVVCREMMSNDVELSRMPVYMRTVSPHLQSPSAKQA